MLLPLARTSPTTSALYSVVNFRRFRRSMDPVSITLEVSTNSGQAHMRTGEPSAFPEPERPLRPSRTQRVKRLLLGRPKNLQDPHLFRHISLIAFLAWVVAANLGRAHEVAHEVSAGLSHGMSTLGF